MITSCKHIADLFLGFHHDRKQWRNDFCEGTDGDTEGKFSAKTHLKDVMWFAEHQKRNLWFGLQFFDEKENFTDFVHHVLLVDKKE